MQGSTVLPGENRSNGGELVRRMEDSVDGPDAYARFLRGETVTDDEDEYDPEPIPGSASGTTSASESSSSDTGGEDTENENETVGLYADLSTAVSSSTSAPLMLAHMTDTSSSPLTRRRYSRLVGGDRERQLSPDTGSIFDDWSKVVYDRRTGFDDAGHGIDEGMMDSRRNCVICTVEPRQIICWPCRYVF